MKARLSSALIVFALIAATATVSAQEPTPPPDEFLEALDVTLDDLAAETPNHAWDGLGIFSDDALQIIEAATTDRPAITYGFGDDPNGEPLFVPAGGTPVGSGAMYWHLPDDWTPPTEGFGDSMAFAQTPGTKLSASETVLLLWMEMDSDYDFSSGLGLNEGFPLTVPGLPVWNSTFAGDTWEGANVIPNAVYDNGVLTLDVKQYEPPQSFPLIDLAAFYYRSGNIMAMAVSADGLAEIARSATTANTASSEGVTRNLLYTGEDETIPAVQPWTAVDEILEEILYFGWSHITRDGQFTPGFIAFLVDEFGPLQALIALTTAITIFGLPPGSEPPPPAEEPDPTPVDPEPAAVTDEPDPAPAVAEPVSSPESASTNDGGVSTILLVVTLIGLVLLLVGLWLRRRRRTPEDDDPRDTPPPTIFGEEIDKNSCDWELHFNSGGTWEVLREAAPGREKCCIYRVEIESKTIFHDEVASFRQDVLPERTYIPDLASTTTGMDHFSSSSTRSGPAGRQDWQHGLGNPTDQTSLGDPSSYWQNAQGDERPELTAQMAHVELTRVKATLQSGCTGHENNYNVSASGAVSVMSTHECTNDNPGPGCPVELNAYGTHLGLALGDLTLGFVEATGTDIDELERFTSALKKLGAQELERAGDPPIPAIGKWDGHDHEVRDRLTYENTEDDTDHPIKTGDDWETWFLTVSVHLAGQLVPVSVWESTERVSTHIQAGFEWDLTLTGEMEKKLCAPGPCAGHPHLTCHGKPSFVLALQGADNTLQVDGKTFDLSRPVFTPPDGLSIPRITTLWDASLAGPIGIP